MDNSFSEMGGVTPSCVTLVTGTPGAGKTTLMATMGARLFIFACVHTEEDVDQTVKALADSLDAMVAEGTLKRA